MRFLLTLMCLLVVSTSAMAQDTQSAENCITIMGDSLPEGTFVASLPGTGVTVLQGERISHILDDALRDADLLHYGIYDLSLGASSLAVPDGNSYLSTPEAINGSLLNCRYVVIFPFLNDLYRADDTEDGIERYSENLNRLITGITIGSPDSQMILMSYYPTTLQGVGNMTYGDDVSVAHVANMNEVHQLICEMQSTASCIDLTPLLVPVTEYVVGEISQSAYADSAYTLLNPDEQAMVDAFWRGNPTIPIYGDGLHFNPAGQELIVNTLMAHFARLDPDNFVPYLDRFTPVP